MKNSIPLSYEEQVRQIGEDEYELEMYNIFDKNGNCIAQMMANAPEFVEACNNYERLQAENIAWETNYNNLHAEFEEISAIAYEKSQEAERYKQAIEDMKVRYGA